MAEPFGFDWGSHIYAKLVATSIYGDSETSEIGNDAIIMTVPDAPTNLEEVVEMR